MYKNQLSWDPVRQKPKLRSGDALIVLPHRQIIVDITFTTQINKAKSNVKSYGFNATKKEEWKRRQIAKDFKIPNGHYIAMGLEAQGAWGDSAHNFLRNRFDVLRDNNEVEKHAWSNMTQNIGTAIRAANSLYLDFCRLHNAPTLYDPDDSLQDDDYDDEEIALTRQEMKNQAGDPTQVNQNSNVQASTPIQAAGSSPESQESQDESV